MPLVTIKHPFTYRHPDDRLEPITPGTYDFPEEMANNDYLLYHSENRPYVPPRPGTPEYAQADHRRKVRRQLLVEHAEELEDAQREADKAAEIRRQFIAPSVSEDLTSPEQDPMPTRASPRGGTKIGRVT